MCEFDLCVAYICASSAIVYVYGTEASHTVTIIKLIRNTFGKWCEKTCDKFQRSCYQQNQFPDAVNKLQISALFAGVWVLINIFLCYLLSLHFVAFFSKQNATLFTKTIEKQRKVFLLDVCKCAGTVLNIVFTSPDMSSRKTFSKIGGGPKAKTSRIGQINLITVVFCAVIGKFLSGV